jgi:hypothetical protein
MKKTKPAIDLQTFREIAMALPAAEEKNSYGTLGFFVRKKLFARWHQDGDKLVVRVENLARDAWFDIDPDTFFITDHYRGYPYMLVSLRVDIKTLRKVLGEAWEQAAPPRLRDARHG